MRIHLLTHLFINFFYQPIHLHSACGKKIENPLAELENLAHSIFKTFTPSCTSGHVEKKLKLRHARGSDHVQVPFQVMRRATLCLR